LTAVAAPDPTAGDGLALPTAGPAGHVGRAGPGGGAGGGRGGGARLGDGAGLARATATVSALNLLSRATGFVRMAVLVAVVGTTFLGNTYQAANGVPNLLFELFAAGVLQAVLVPELVAVLDREGRAAAERVAGQVLGALLGALGIVLVLGWLAAPLVSRLLFATAPDAVRTDQVWLGTVFLWIFLPQVLFYALGMVSTATLNAQDRFAVPAFSPLLNNVVVVGAYLGFWALVGGDEPGLHLSPLEVAVLAGGTTLGVITFTSAPLVAVWRKGIRLRPRLDLRDPRLRRLARQGIWAGVFLALTQVLLLTALALGNSVEGGSVVYQYAYTAFLLPHALVSIPIFTALFPSLARAAQQDRNGTADGYASLLRRGIHAIAILVMPATVGMIVLGLPAARLLVLGHSAASAEAVAWAIAAFGPGVAAYGIFLLLARGCYAHGDAKLPAMAHILVTAVGVAGMALATVLAHGSARIAALAGAHSVAYVLGAVLLGVALARRRGGAVLVQPMVVARALGAGAVVAGVMAASRLLDLGGERTTALVQVAVGGVAGLAAYVALMRLLGLGDPRRLLHPEARNHA
jgi:putative peptidoglycan lipid II flippase